MKLTAEQDEMIQSIQQQDQLLDVFSRRLLIHYTMRWSGQRTAILEAAKKATAQKLAEYVYQRQGQLYRVANVEVLPFSLIVCDNISLKSLVHQKTLENSVQSAEKSSFNSELTDRPLLMCSRWDIDKFFQYCGFMDKDGNVLKLVERIIWSGSDEVLRNNIARHRCALKMWHVVEKIVQQPVRPNSNLELAQWTLPRPMMFKRFKVDYDDVDWSRFNAAEPGTITLKSHAVCSLRPEAFDRYNAITWMLLDMLKNMADKLDADCRSPVLACCNRQVRIGVRSCRNCGTEWDFATQKVVYVEREDLFDNEQIAAFLNVNQMVLAYPSPMSVITDFCYMILLGEVKAQEQLNVFLFVNTRKVTVFCLDTSQCPDSDDDASDDDSD